MNISAVIIVKNAELTISATLESLKAFNEVILYDNGSDDNTLNIAERFENVRIIQGEFIGFGPTKNLAASYAENDWIFSIDSDEVVSPNLLSLLQTTSLDAGAVYSIERFNYYQKKRVRFSGWRKEIIFRLYNRKTVSFNDKMLHETLEIPGNVKKKHLKAEIRHYSFHSTSDFIHKINLYSDFYANARKGKKSGSPLRAVISGFYEFFNKYILRFGFLDGYRGLLISFSAGAGAFYKYIKLYEFNRKDTKCSLIITTYNRPDALLKTLESVLYQTVPPDEIIVADDGSKEKTRELINNFAKNSFIPLKHSWQEDKGFRLARSRNLAIAKSSYDYIIVIDGDMILHKSFVEDHLACAQEGFYIQGSRVFLKENLTKDILADNKKVPDIVFSAGIKNRLNGIYAPLLSKLFCRKISRSHDSIRGCNFSLYKKDILEVNGFNEDITGWGREDSEFVERLYNNGVRRKNLKFRAIQYHLYHPEGSAASVNNAILQKAIDQKLKWCENGINQHL